MRKRRRPLIALVALLPALLVGCEDDAPLLVPEVIRTLPHDAGAYTQGLLLHGGLFYESTGQYGTSSLREVDPETGQVLRMRALDEDYFGEGLALVDGRLIQLTWKEGTAFVWDLETFEEVDRFSYEGEGWGLCYDGSALFMTSGSAFLQRRDPETFEVLEVIQVVRDGRPVREVNELACVGEHIYANVFMSDVILKIHKLTGEVVAQIDAGGLVPEGGRPADPGAVLNGIAHDPASDTFYLTGKLWPTMFEVRFVEQR